MTESKRIRKPRPIQDLTGMSVGKLTVLSFFGQEPKSGCWTWLCSCECGSTAIATGSNLRRGVVKSCGCINKTRIGDSVRTHGMNGTRICRIYNAMIARCHHPHAWAYENYGGRGIKVCDRWLKSIRFFVEDMGPIPSEMHSIDRIDCNGHYEPGNCRWATMKEQNRNRRSNKIIEWNGQSKCLTEWSEVIGLKFTTLNRRLNAGWSVQKAFTTPPLTLGPRSADSAASQLVPKDQK